MVIGRENSGLQRTGGRLLGTGQGEITTETAIDVHHGRKFHRGLPAASDTLRYVPHPGLLFASVQSIAQAPGAGKSGVSGTVFGGETVLPDTLPRLSSARTVYRRRQ